MCSNRTCKPASYGSGILHCGQASLIAYHPINQLSLAGGCKLLTHKWSTVLQILLVMRNTIAGQVMTCEVKSMSSPEIILNGQLIVLGASWKMAHLVSMFSKRDDHARRLVRKLECCTSARICCRKTWHTVPQVQQKCSGVLKLFLSCQQEL